jgi:hypothetical protein
MKRIFQTNRKKMSRTTFSTQPSLANMTHGREEELFVIFGKLRK